jgi:hypothetical protein
MACLGIGSGSGCSILSGIQNSLTNHDGCDEFMVGYRNTAWSARSWHHNKHKFCNHKHIKDFQAGYRQGYEDVAAGGNGCTPALSPQSYWGWQYQSPEGQAKVNAWFEAYPLGARAAEEDGLGSWGHIRTMLPAQQVTPPPGPLPGPVPVGGAPTPVGPPVMGGNGLSTPPGTAGVAGGNGPFDFSSFNPASLPRLTAADVPTAATGR